MTSQLRVGSLSGTGLTDYTNRYIVQRGAELLGIEDLNYQCVTKYYFVKFYFS